MVKLYKQSSLIININIKHLKVGTLSSNFPANEFYKSTGGKFYASFSIYDRVWNKYSYNLLKIKKL